MPLPANENGAPVEYVDSGECAKIDTYFWGELCFYDTITDEFTGKGVREIPRFVDEVRAGVAQHGVEVVLSQEPHGLTIDVRTQSPSAEARDMVVRVLETLQRRYLCTIRDFRVPENIEDVWGSDFALGFAVETDSSTAMGRRHFLQYALNEQHRLTAQMKNHMRVIIQIDDTLARYDSDPAYRGQVEIHQLLRQDLDRQVGEMEQQLKHLREVTAAGMEVNAVVTATRRQSHGVVRPPFPFPVAGVPQEIEWYGLDEPRQVRPPLCSTVSDILYHPILRSALSRVTCESGDGYEVDLIRVLSDPKKLDALLHSARKILKHIDKKKGVTDVQIERGMRGIFALVAFVKQFPDELFFDELKSEKLKDVDFAVDIPPSLELVNLLYAVRNKLGKNVIFNSKKPLCPDMADVAKAEEIRDTGAGSVKVAIMKDGTEIYFVQNESGVVMPAFFDGKKITGIAGVSSYSGFTEKLKWFRVTLDDGSVRYVTSKLVPAEVSSSEVVDAYDFDAADGLVSSSHYLCVRNKNGFWYDYYPQSHKFEQVPKSFIAHEDGSTMYVKVDTSGFTIPKITLVSLTNKKLLVIDFAKLFSHMAGMLRPKEITVYADPTGCFRVGDIKKYDANLKEIA